MKTGNTHPSGFATPAENETVFNVGALNGRIAAMQKRIDTLEKELAASKK